MKLHTLLDLRGNIPTFIHISDGKLSDVKALDLLVPEPGAFYIMDRGYFDFARLYRLHIAAAFFLIRAKSDTQVRRQYSRAVDRSTGLRCDQTIRPSGKHSPRLYPEQLRRIKYYDAETDKTFVFLTNNFELPALTIAELYRCRWRVELFFKWIKQHLRIKTFFGTSENAVKTQVWIAVCVYAAGGHRQEAARNPGLTLHHVTDTEPHPIRADSTKSDTYGRFGAGLQKSWGRSQQPIEFIR